MLEWIIYALVLFYIDLNYLLFILSSFFPLEAKNIKLKKYPKVSVIIPTRNEGHVIEQTLKRLKKSNYPSKLEIIIVDANSTDNTIKIARKYTRKIIIEKRPRGKPHAINLGIKKATGELIYFLDADNLVQKNTIKTLVSSMETNAASGFATVRNDVGLMEKVSSIENNIHTLIQMGMARILKLEIVSGFNFIIRKKTLKKVGGFKDALTEDINISYRLYKIGERIDIVDASCSILVPKSLKVYWKQQERWRKGGIDEIGESLKTGNFVDIFIRMPFLTIVASIGAVSIIMLVLAIIFWNAIFLSAFILSAILILASTLKYDRKNLPYLPMVYIYYAIIEIGSDVKVLIEKMIGKKVKWEKTEK